MATATASSASYVQTSKVFFSVIALFLASVFLLSSILIPIIIAFSLYSLLYPLTHWMIRQNIPHTLSIIISIILMLGISSVALLYAIPKLLDQLLQLNQRLPDMLATIENLATSANSKLTELSGIELNMNGILMDILAKISSHGDTAFLYLTNQITSALMIGILVPFLTYFLLKDFRSFRNNFMNWIPNQNFELGWYIYHRVTNQLENYTRGVLLQSFIMSLVASIGFYIIGLDIPILMGLITGLLNLIPYIGPLISMAFSFLIALAMSPFEPSLLYLVIVVIVVAQVIDNIVVIPYVLANAVNLHPIMVILGVIIFGSLFGMVGVILAIPAIAAAKILFINLHSNIDNLARHRVTNL